MDFRQDPLDSIRIRHWDAEGNLQSDETITFGEPEMTEDEVQK
jgi:hypothetical protein